MNTDPYVYNCPAINKVTALIPTFSHTIEGIHQIMLENHIGAGLEFISKQLPEYLPLLYLLLYPHTKLS
jgi:hypothetical protein